MIAHQTPAKMALPALIESMATIVNVSLASLEVTVR